MIFYNIVLLDFLLLLDIIEVSARSKFFEYSGAALRCCTKRTLDKNKTNVNE